MRHELNLWVAGGDLRQAELAQLLAADGHTVHTWALEGHGSLTGVHMEEDTAGAELADCVILPLPSEEEGGLLHAPLSHRPRQLAELLAPLRPGQLVCAGMAGPVLTAPPPRGPSRSLWRSCPSPSTGPGCWSSALAASARPWPGGWPVWGPG